MKYRLTFAQTRLWIEYKLKPAKAKYNLPVILKLDKNFDSNIFLKVWTSLGNAHEALRTSFTEENGTPYQYIHNQVDVQIESVQIPQNFSKKQIENIINDLISYDFNLTQAPLYKLFILNGHNEKYLILLFHHIIMDGRSINILLDNISSRYTKYTITNQLEKQSITIPSIKKYLSFEQNLYKNLEQPATINFWKSYLAGANLSLDISDKIVKGRTEKRRRQYFAIMQQDLILLQNYIAQNGGTTFIAICTIFMCLLHRYTNKNDIIIAYPSGRRNKQFQQNIGFFVNNLPLRLQITDDMTFNQAFLQVKRDRLQSRAHQDYPLEKIMEHFRKHNANSSDIFNVGVSASHFGLSGLNIKNIKCETLLPTIGSSGEDLTLIYEQHNDQIFCALEYRTDLFTQNLIEDMSITIKSFLTNLLTESNKTISSINLLDKKKKQNIIQKTTSKKISYADNKNIHRIFEEQVTKSSNKTAIIFQNSCIKYHELNEKSNQIANYLRNLGVVKGETVGIALNRSANTIICILAVLKSGGSYLPIDVEFPKKRVSSIIKNAKIKYLITEKNILEQYESFNIPFIINIDSLKHIFNSYSKSNIVRRNESLNDLAYVIYTSGSTGQPKGVAIKHQSLVNYIKWADEYYPNSQRSIGTILHSSVAYDMSITSIFLPLIRGQAILVLAQQQNILSYNPDLENYKNFCFLKLTPSHLKIIDLKTLGRIHFNSLIIGGEDLQYDLLLSKKSMAKNFYNEYGPTEATVGSSVYNCSRFLKTGKVPIGKPISNAEMYILDKYLQPLPIGAIGEIYIGGSVLAKEYLNNSEMTKNKFVSNSFSTKKMNSLYKTGDMAKYLSNYDIEYIGRIDKQIKIRGYRIELEEINLTLESFEAVKHAVSKICDDQIVSYIVKSNNTESILNKDLSKLRIKNWNTIYKSIYKHDYQTTIKDFAGWTSNYTTLQIPEHEMQEWVSETLDRILLLKPQKVLEIGCGTGLILKGVAPYCSSYVATDFSDKSIEHINQLKLNNHALKHVETIHGDAIEIFNFIKEQEYDLVILNSVVQYFPDINYLQNVLLKSIQILGKNGKIFIGDIRNYRLLDIYYTSIYAYRNKKITDYSQVQQFIDISFKQEEELLIDPMYFNALHEIIPKIKHVKVELKYGVHKNELNKFRYDTTLYYSTDNNETYIDKWYNWKEKPMSIENIVTILQTTDTIGIRQIKNSRLKKDNQLLNRIKNIASDSNDGIEPNELKDLAHKMNLYFETSLINHCNNGEYDIIFTKNNSYNQNFKFFQEKTNESFKQAKLFNNPIKKEMDTHLISNLISDLNKTLPQYMLPSQIIILDTLPVNQNGKLEISKLPLPIKVGVSNYDINIMTNFERAIYLMWSKLLGTSNININDNFFFLGGTSILLIKLLDMIRKKFFIDPSLEKLLKNPTIKYISKLVSQTKSNKKISTYPEMQKISNRSNPFPLSYAQTRLWFLNHFLPNKAIYNMYLPVEIKGTLSIQTIKTTLAILANRHEILRTSIITDSRGNGMQIVNDKVEIPLEILDLQNLYCEQTITQLIINKINQSFDIAQAPLIRFHLFNISKNQTILLFVIHHIISDGSSQEMLLQEFKTIYNSIKNGTTPNLKRLKFQYIDFALWQNNLIQGEYLSNQLEYWKERLNGIPRELFSRTDHIRPKKLTYRGKTQFVKLSSDTYKKLKNLSQENYTSIFNVCLTIFAILMHIVTKKNDIVIGTPVSNRHYPNVENIIGFFSNTVPIRVTIKENVTFYDILNLVKDRWSEILTYQDTPFEKLADLLNFKGSLNINPIFQVETIYQELDDNIFELGENKAKILDIHNEISRFDMILMTKASKNGLKYEIEYSEDLFVEDTIQKLLFDLKSITIKILKNQDISIDELKKLVENHA